MVVFCGINMEKSSFDLKYPDITITQYSEENIVCRAKNIGIKKARGEYMFLIDDDAMVGEDFLLKLCELVKSKANVYCAKIQDRRLKGVLQKRKCAFREKTAKSGLQSVQGKPPDY